MQESLLDINVCCICSRSLFKKFGLHNWITFATIIMSFAGCIFNVIYYNDPNNIPHEIHETGLYTLHITKCSYTYDVIFRKIPIRIPA